MNTVNNWWIHCRTGNPACVLHGSINGQVHLSRVYAIDAANRQITVGNSDGGRSVVQLGNHRDGKNGAEQDSLLRAAHEWISV